MRLASRDVVIHHWETQFTAIPAAYLPYACTQFCKLYMHFFTELHSQAETLLTS